MNSTENIAPKIEESWLNALSDEFNADYFKDLKKFLVSEIESGKIIYPKGSDIFKAFDYCPLPNVKAVIIGQDPYHGEGQANGLCFSVAKGIKTPPSLVNIYKEISIDLGYPIPNHGDLSTWAQQGVLMLNSVLTVEANKAASHQKRGWERFTNAAIESVSQTQDKVVFLLWGKYAQQKAALIDSKKHLILQSAHPSPLSAYNGFFNCNHFSKTNEYLISNGIKPINWKID